MTTAPSGSNSSDYFGSDDSQFFEALASTVLPGDLGFDEQAGGTEDLEPLANTVFPGDLGLDEQVGGIKDLSEDEEVDETMEFSELSPPPPNQKAFVRPAKRKMEAESHDPDNDDDPQREEIYGAARFGDFGQYMKRKRAKLQIQNKDIAMNGGIFQGISIYINGYTNPSIQVLRQLIVQHGGVFQPYLDKKTIVTHIITTALTPAKISEWKHMKIVCPEWLVDSAHQGMLLPWKDYIWKPTNRLETTQGASSTQNPLNLPTERKPPSAASELSHNYEERRTTPSYAAYDSNPLAQRAMHNQNWRAAHTSVAPDFIDGYYKNSRLHHLSSWKSELKELLREAQEKAENEPGEVKVPGSADLSTTGQGFSMRGAGLILRSPMKANPADVKGKGRAVEEQRVIMHCDFDCFFVAAGLTKRPNLKGKPVVVCHSQEKQGGDASTSEIASASYEAREFGIKNGMSLQQARKLCPKVITIPYEFELYKQFSLKFYTVLMIHADDLQAVSVDEALIDVTLAVDSLRRSEDKKDSTTLRPYDPAKELAEQIRKQVKDCTGCEISIGISHNISLARLATRRAKPAKSYHLVPDEVQTFLAPLDIADLHGFGRAAKQKAVDKWGTSNLGDLEEKSKAALCAVLGRATGETLYNLIRGVDERRLENDKERKSVSCDINYGIRFQTNDEVKIFLTQMAQEVTKRLEAIQRRGRSITLKVMKRDPSAPVEPPKFLGHGACDVFNKQTALSGPGGLATRDANIIADTAWRLLKSLNFDAKELRGLGIQIQKLESRSTSPSQSHKQGQGRLPFLKSVFRHENEGDSSSGTRGPDRKDSGAMGSTSELPAKLIIGQDATHAASDLPSFSQVDKSIFEALPQDIKQELENEYKRRSASPFVPAAPPPDQRSAGHLIPYPAKRPPDVLNRAIVFPFPRKMPSPGGPNVRRITAQLDPSRSRSSFSPRKPKHNPFTKLPGLASWKVPESELLKLEIDPEVFAALPRNVQREQITAARMLKTLGYIPQGTDERVELRPIEPDPGDVTYLPPPKARFVQPPMLKQAGPIPGEKLYFIETDDVQRVIEEWVMRFKLYPPNKQDISFFAKWLVKSVSQAQAGDEGLFRAVAVMKWWLVLLKRWWGNYEHGPSYDDDPEAGKKAKIGQAWWDAFRGVKSQMDDVARLRFGGKLSLR